MALHETVRQLEEKLTASLRNASESLHKQVGERVSAMTSELRDSLSKIDLDLPQDWIDRGSLEAEVASLVHNSGSAGQRQSLRHLLAGIAQIDRARTQAEILDGLLEAARDSVPRIALFLLRGEEVTGWSGYGFGSEPESVRGLTFVPPATTALASAADAQATRRLSGTECASICSYLESSIPVEGALLPLVLRDRNAAVVYCDTPKDAGTALDLEAVQILTYVASQAIETLVFRERDSTSTLQIAGEGQDETGEAAVVDTDETPEEDSSSAVAATVVGSAIAAAAVGGIAAAAAGEEEEEEEEEEAGQEEPKTQETKVEIDDEPAPETAEAPAATEAMGADATDSAVEEFLLESTDTLEELTPLSSTTEQPEPGDEDEGVDETQEPSTEFSDTPTIEADIEFDLQGDDVADETPEAQPEELDHSSEFVDTKEELPTLPELEAANTAEDAETHAAEDVTESSEPQAQASEPEASEAQPVFEEYPAPAETTGPKVGGFEEFDGLSPASTAAVPVPEPQAEASATPATPEAEPETPAVEVSAADEAPTPANLDPDETLLLQRPPVAPAGSPGLPPIAPPTPAAEPEAPKAPSQATQVEPPSDIVGPGWAFSTAKTPLGEGRDDPHDAARRLAQLLITEIELYNQDEVEEGRSNRDLYERLRDDIDRARQTFEERVDASVRQAKDHFYEALVRILAKGDAKALGI